MGGDVIALRDAIPNRHLRNARNRILKNPNDNLSDIVEEMNEEREQIKRETRGKILQTWFIDALYLGDYKSAQRALTKCMTLKPSKSVSVQEANELLPILWQSCQKLFGEEDFSGLMKELDRLVALSELDE